MDKVLIGKAILSVAFCAIAAACLRMSKDTRKFEWSTTRLIALFLLLRIGTYVCCFLVLKFDAQSDVLEYHRMSRLVAAGHIPGESEAMPMHYGPLFLYITAFVTDVWDDPKAIIVFMTICELVSFAAWLWLGNRIFRKTTLTRAAILYACCPMSILSGVIAGNNDLLSGAFVAFVVIYAASNRSVWSGMTFGLSIVASKALTLLSGLPIFFASRNKVAWLAGVALPVVAVYGLWVLLSVDILAGFRFHGVDFSSGNLPFVLELIGLDIGAPAARSVVNGIGAILVLAVACLPILARRPISIASAVILIAATNVVFLLVSAKSFPHYVAIALFPIAIALATQKAHARIFWLYCTYNFSASLESSMWFRWFKNAHPAAITGLPSLNLAHYSMFVALEALLLACYAAMAWIFVRSFFEQAHPEAAEIHART
jgi:hypothetical protein